MNFKVGNLLNADFDFQDLELSTPVTYIFGWGLCPKLLELLIPDEDILIAAEYDDSEISLERLFAFTPVEILRWNNEDYPDGFFNTEIDIIGFVLQLAKSNDHEPQINRFFGSQFRQKYAK